LDNALATMGAGLPSAIGASFVYPDHKIVAVCGDGGFMMNGQSLETAVRLKRNLVILLLRDNGFGMIKWKQANMHFPEFGLDFGNPDFVKFANCHGAKGHRVTKIDEFTTLFAQCLDEPGVSLLEVPIDYSESVYDLGEGLQKQTCDL